MILVGDIGGTHTRLALVSPEASAAAPVVAEQVFGSASYDGLEALVRAFLQQNPFDGEKAVFAVAGPVVGGHAELTNLGWSLSESRLRDGLRLKSVRLLNDLLATAIAVPTLPLDAMHTLQSGVPEPGGARAVVAPGTGLGEAFVVWDGTRHRAYPSEGGHADFAPADALQLELLTWMKTSFEHVSYERVCSGRGLPNLYAFLKQRGDAAEEEWLAARLANSRDQTRVISEAGMAEHERSPLCTATLELFAAILAAEAGNAALRVLATGGVYLCGGMVPPLLPILKQPAFTEIFRSKGRLGELLARVPLHVILQRETALRGAIHYALTEK
jgi:glucokinase